MGLPATILFAARRLRAIMTVAPFLDTGAGP